MRDVLNPVLKWLDHNRWLALAIVLSVAVCGWGFGCESLTGSLTDPVAKVNRAQLESEVAELKAKLNTDATAMAARHQAEIAAIVERAETVETKLSIATADLDRQDAQRQQIFEFVGGLVTAAAAGTVNPATLLAGAVPIVAGLVGGGALIDNRRKNRVIETLKANGST